ncbi:hypothetical protein GF319_06190, partial [Candidatus Bathyarchaeota archaeon]|nr:hypothetical protein [Candidatus Bathyarchaeota archaeon]
MTRMEYETRLYKEGDEEGIIPLLELVFDSWPRFDLSCSKREHWIWKFVDTPTGLNEVFVAETPDGEIIGAS